MRRQHKPVESHIFAGMESDVERQAEAAAEYSGQELTAKLLEPMGSIDTKAARMEQDAPLFYGSIHPTLF